MYLYTIYQRRIVYLNMMKKMVLTSGRDTLKKRSFFTIEAETNDFIILKCGLNQAQSIRWH